MLLFGTLAMAVAMIASCEEDPKPTTNTPPDTKVSPYILFNGLKFVCANQTSLKYTKSAGDSAVEWGSTDTILVFTFADGESKKVGTYKVDSTYSGNSGTVSMVFNYGINVSSPVLDVNKGTYEVKKVNGKYYSYLTKGEGVNRKTGKRYYGIEFIAPWP